MKDFSDDSGQISAEMILLIGAMLVIVIIAGGYILDSVIGTARDTSINRM